MLTIYFNSSDYTQYQFSTFSHIKDVLLYSNNFTIREIIEKLDLYNKTFTEINPILPTAITNENHFNLIHFILIICWIIIICFIVGLLMYMKRKGWWHRYFDMSNKEHKTDHDYDEIIMVDEKKLNNTQSGNKGDCKKRTVS